MPLDITQEEFDQIQKETRAKAQGQPRPRKTPSDISQEEFDQIQKATAQRTAEARGFPMDLLSSVIRNVTVDMPQLGLRSAKAIESVGRRIARDAVKPEFHEETGLTEDYGLIGEAATGAIETLEDFKSKSGFLTPKRDPNFVSEGVGAAALSLSSRLPGAAVGAAVGSVVPAIGTLLGGIIGYVASGAVGFGLAEYQSVIDEAEKEGISRKEAESAAFYSGLAESGFEFASDVLTFGILKLGKPLTKPAEETFKNGIRQIFKLGFKQKALQAGSIMFSETGTEMITAGVQAEQYKKIGLGDQDFWEGVTESFGPSFVASTIFAAVGVGASSLSRRSLRRSLEDKTADPEQRLMAASEVERVLRTVDNDTADIWVINSGMAIANEESIDIDNHDMILAEALRTAPEDTVEAVQKREAEIKEDLETKKRDDTYRYISAGIAREDIDDDRARAVGQEFDLDPSQINQALINGYDLKVLLDTGEVDELKAYAKQEGIAIPESITAANQVSALIRESVNEDADELVKLTNQIATLEETADTIGTERAKQNLQEKQEALETVLPPAEEVEITEEEDLEVLPEEFEKKIEELAVDEKAESKARSDEMLALRAARKLAKDSGVPYEPEWTSDQVVEALDKYFDELEGTVPIAKEEGKPLTKKEQSAQEYKAYLETLTDEQKAQAGDLIIEEPPSPGIQKLKIQKKLARAKPEDELKLEKLKADLEGKGAGSMPDIKRAGSRIGYKITQEDNGAFTVERTERGVRTKIGVPDDGLTMEEARERAIEAAQGDIGPPVEEKPEVGEEFNEWKEKARTKPKGSHSVKISKERDRWFWRNANGEVGEVLISDFKDSPLGSAKELARGEAAHKATVEAKPTTFHGKLDAAKDEGEKLLISQIEGMRGEAKLGTTTVERKKELLDNLKDWVPALEGYREGKEPSREILDKHPYLSRIFYDAREAKAAPSLKFPTPKESKVATMRGRIKEFGGMAFGKLADKPKYSDLIRKLTDTKEGSLLLAQIRNESKGLQADKALDDLSEFLTAEERSWDKADPIEGFLQNMIDDPKGFMSRKVLGEDMALPEDAEFKPEAPPEGDYQTIRAEDLPEGKKVTLIDNKSKTGWDVYEVTEKDPFSITLVDGETIELKPMDKVQMLRTDVEEMEGPVKVGNIWFDTISPEQWNDAEKLKAYQDDLQTEVDKDSAAGVANVWISDRLKELGYEKPIDLSGITSYRSGANVISDMKGYIDADVPIGVDVGKLSVKALNTLADYAKKGGKVFVDSGAFSAFKSGKEVDFDKIFDAYDDVVEKTKGNVTIVAPDVIGDQAATLKLIQKHGDKINDYIDKGVDVIVPIQKGDETPSGAWSIMTHLIGSSNFRVGIPLNKKAFSDADLEQLLKQAIRPNKFHLLGISPANRNFAGKVQKIKGLVDNADITSDANRLLAKVGQGRPITVRQKEIVERAKAEYFDMRADEDFDDTELDIEGDFADLTDGEWWVYVQDQKESFKQEIQDEIDEIAKLEAPGARREAVAKTAKEKHEKPSLEEIYATFDENERAGVRVGLFPIKIQEYDLTPQQSADLIRMAEGPLVEGDKRIPSKKVADKVEANIADGMISEELLGAKNLQSWADKAFGGTMAEGKYTVKDMYDALELGVNQYILNSTMTMNHGPEGAEGMVKNLKRMVNRLPTQTKRTEEMDEFQQFSTPPPLGFVANWVAKVTRDDVYLEPSAGIGGLAVFGKLAKAKQVAVNELSKTRAKLLSQLGFDTLTSEDASQLNNLDIFKDVKATVIVMNPPFSATAGRVKGRRQTKEGAKHIEQALKKLEPNGRLVAIVGKGMARDKPAFQDWWEDIEAEYNVKANIGISGKEYKKYGTSFDNQIIVIDKTGPTPEGVYPDYRIGQVQKIQDLIPLLKEIRNARILEREQPSGKPGREEGVKEPRAGTTVLPTGGRPGGEVGPVRGEVPTTVGEPGGVPVGVEPKKGDEILVGGTQPTVGLPEETRPVEPGGRGTGTIAQPIDSDLGGIPEAKSTSGQLQVRAVQKEAKGELTEALYDDYKPERLEIKDAQSHPTPLVQSAAMSAVSPPLPSYVPLIPQKAVKDGHLSDIQLEAITYAGEAHEQVLSDGRRKGYFIGDGTGVGKGREIAGVLWDNWLRGRKKGVWLSEKASLFKDAKRDVKGAGWNPRNIFQWNKTLSGKEILQKHGILFGSYDTLKQVPSDEGKTTRIDQLAAWLGEDFDGVIAFDESHNMGNALAIKGVRGKTKPSQKALAGVALQDRFPNARILYVSATGATEVRNLSYASRLDMWGEGTSFSTVRQFIDGISSGGVASMEMVAQNLKATGAYTSRSLSYDGVEYEMIRHDLTDNQQEQYNKASDAWRLVLENFNDALEVTEGENSGQAKSNAKSIFWGTNLRFFSQIVTSMKMPSIIGNIRKDLDEGRSVVIQLVNTLDAAQDRALARLTETDSLDDLDLSPFDDLMQMVERAFPTTQYQEVMDDKGNTTWVPVQDSQGNRVENAEAVQMREALLDELGSLRGEFSEGPIDQVIAEFGVDIVAEVTGRGRRVVEKITDKGTEKVIEKRSNAKANADADAFMMGEKRVLIFSEKGGTGASYHSDLDAINQQQRSHYLLQPGWRADKAIQGLGRTHRSNQAHPPIYHLVTTNLKGEIRFISSIARRLDQLGALTKGSRETGSQGIFQAKDNLETPYAEDAFQNLLTDISRGHVENFSVAEFEEQTALDLVDDEGNLLAKRYTVKNLLNRILSMNIDKQNNLFDELSIRVADVIEAHAENGTLDVGLETLRGDQIAKISEEVVHTDDKSGAETKYVQLDVTNPAPLFHFIEALKFATGPLPADGFYKNIKSGRIWAARERRVLNRRTGDIEEKVFLKSQTFTAQKLDLEKVQDEEVWEKLSDEDAKTQWIEAIDTLPRTITERRNLVTGVLLPVWNRLIGHPRIMRVQTDDGEVMIGRLIAPKDLSDTLKRLGATQAKISTTPKQMHTQIVDNNYRYELANGWELKRRMVSGDYRIELSGLSYGDFDILKNFGVFSERIYYQTRYFIPTDTKGHETLKRLLGHSPAVEEIPPHGQYAIGKSIPVVGGKPIMELVRKLPFLSKQNVGLSTAGDIWVRTKKGYGFTIKAVNNISPDRASLEIEHGRMLENGELITGKYQAGTIELQKDMADEWTLAHETMHWMEDIGLISVTDADVLSNHIKNLAKNGKWDSQGRPVGEAEDRAVWLSQFLRDRSQPGMIRNILKKIADFVDMIVSQFVKTARSIGRGVESGKVFNKMPKSVAKGLAYEQANQRWYSGMEFFISDNLDEKGTPESYKQAINSWANKGKFKGEELEWSGLNEWLDEKVANRKIVSDLPKITDTKPAKKDDPYSNIYTFADGLRMGASSKAEAFREYYFDRTGKKLSEKADFEDKLTKQEVLDYLEQNNARITEVVRGRPPVEPAREDVEWDTEITWEQTSEVLWEGTVEDPINMEIISLEIEQRRSEDETVYDVFIQQGLTATANSLEQAKEMAEDEIQQYAQETGDMLFDNAHELADMGIEVGEPEAPALPRPDDYIIDINMRWNEAQSVEPAFGDLDYESNYQKEQLDEEDYLDEEGNVDHDKMEMEANQRAYSDYYEFGLSAVTVEDESQWSIRFSSDNIFEIFDAQDNFVAHHDYEVDIDDVKQMVFAELQNRGLAITEDRAAEMEEALEDAELEEIARVEGEPTRYSEQNVTLSGGENYREMTLHLPEGFAGTWRPALDHFPEEPVSMAHIRFDERTITEPSQLDDMFKAGLFDARTLGLYKTALEKNGELKILHIAEIQSDLHQEGRKKGYNKPITKLNPKWKLEKEDETATGMTQWSIKDERGLLLSDAIYSSDPDYESGVRAAINKMNSMRRKEGVPDAPFKKTWPLLAIKRMVRYATEQGFDVVSWDTGVTQVERYRGALRQRVDEIKWTKKGSDKHENHFEMTKEYQFWAKDQGLPIMSADELQEEVLTQWNRVMGEAAEGDLHPDLSQDRWLLESQHSYLTKFVERWEAVTDDMPPSVDIQAIKDGEPVFSQSDVLLEGTTNIHGRDRTLDDLIGKGMAQKIIASEETTGTFKGDDLTIGGEGMKGFYDRMIPTAVNKFFNKKPWGKAKVGKIKVGEVENVSGATGRLYKTVGAVPGYAWQETDDTELTNVHHFKTLAEAEKASGMTLAKIAHSLPITPEMKIKSLREGMPMFQIGKIDEMKAIDAFPEHARGDIEDARGLEKRSFLTRIKEGGKEVAKSLIPGAAFPSLSKKEYGNVLERLRIFREVSTYSKRKAERDIKKIVGGLTPEEYDIFSYRILVGDILSDIDKEDGPLADWEIAGLPFNFESRDEVADTLDRLDIMLDANPKAKKAFADRRKYMRDLRVDLVKHGFLPKNVLDNEEYWHHQVLDFMILKQGTGTASGDVRAHKKGSFIRRVGSRRLYNTEYVESEFEVLAHGISSIEAKKIVDDIGRDQNIIGELKGKAKAQNEVNTVAAYKAMLGIDQDEVLEGADHPLFPFRRNIAMSMGRLSEMAGRGDLFGPPEFERVIDDLADRNILHDDPMLSGDPGVYSPGFFQYLSYMIQTEQDGAVWAATIFKAIRDRNNYMKSTLGRRYQTWQTLLKRDPDYENYVDWSPKPNSAWYLTSSVSDNILDQVFAGEKPLEQSDIRKVLARGMDKKWVVPKELAEVLDGNDFTRRQENPISIASESIMNWWKRYILINPVRVAKYNLNNLSGDADISMAYDPEIFKHFNKAAKDLWKWHYNKEVTPELEAELELAEKYGIIGGGMTVHDIPDITNRFTEDKAIKAVMGESIDLIGKAKGGWEGLKNFTTWRENILRLATMRRLQQRRAEGKPTAYAASNRDQVNAIKDPYRQDALVARELIGDYGNLSKGGQWLRRKMIPFYSWMEINAPRYVRMIRNLPHEGESTTRAYGMAGVSLGKKGAAFTAKALTFYGMVMLWNHFMWPEEEEALGDNGRRQLHIILPGSRADGTIYTLRLQGALSDAMAWFGAEDFPNDVADVATRKKSVYDWMRDDVGSGFVNRLYQSIRPDAKMLIESVGGVATYPDVFRPRPIRDWGEHASRTVSADIIYRWAFGKPHRAGDEVGARLLHDLSSLITYKSDPGEISYYVTRRWVGKFLEKEGIERPYVTPTSKSNALYYYKQAFKYGDYKAAEKYLLEYKDLGGTMKGMRGSVKRGHPLLSLRTKYRKRFKDSLSPKEKQTLERAIQWYKKTYSKK